MNKPRFCYIEKSSSGYGFNLHGEKSSNQSNTNKFYFHILKEIDEDSPAQRGGLRANDRLVFVNDVRVENKTHSEVVGLIKESGMSTWLLVVDVDTDRHFVNQLKRPIEIADAVYGDAERRDRPVDISDTSMPCDKRVPVSDSSKNETAITAEVLVEYDTATLENPNENGVDESDDRAPAEQNDDVNRDVITTEYTVPDEDIEISSDNVNTNVVESTEDKISINNEPSSESTLEIKSSDATEDNVVYNEASPSPEPPAVDEESETVDYNDPNANETEAQHEETKDEPVTHSEDAVEYTIPSDSNGAQEKRIPPSAFAVNIEAAKPKRKSRAKNAGDWKAKITEFESL